MTFIQNKLFLRISASSTWKNNTFWYAVFVKILSYVFKIATFLNIPIPKFAAYAIHFWRNALILSTQKRQFNIDNVPAQSSIWLLLIRASVWQGNFPLFRRFAVLTELLKIYQQGSRDRDFILVDKIATVDQHVLVHHGNMKEISMFYSMNLLITNLKNKINDSLPLKLR